MSEPTTGMPDVTPGLRLPWDDDPDDLYERAPCGYLSTLPDGTIVKVNETFLTWTGYKRSDLVGRRRFRDLLTAGGRIYHQTHYEPLLSMQDDVHEVAFDVVCADERRLPTLVNSVLSRDPEGRPRVIRTTVFNATERRGYERELLGARRRAEESERRVRIMQAIVAELAAAPTEEGVARAVVRAPVDAFGAVESSIWLVDRDRGQLVPTASTDPAGTGREDVPLRSDRAIAQVARAGELRVVASVAHAEADHPELADTMRRRGLVTVLLLPLTSVPANAAPDVEPTVLGVLAFGFDAPRSLTDAELDVVRLLGHQASQALDRARLYDDARRREARATFLAETTRALDETQRLLTRTERLIEQVVPEVAEWAAVRLLIGPQGVHAEAGAPAPDPVRLAARVTAVAAAGKPSFVDDGPDPDCAVLPLTARGRVLGTIALRLPPGGRTAAAEASFLLDLADRAALALENARLYEQERTIAQTLQRSLLAGDVPADRRFAVETHYQPATQDLEVGGDWFDAFLINSDKLVVVVGDVVGRGIDAATTMGQLRSAIRALASAEAGPARLLERLDMFVVRVESARMATVAYAEITLSTGEMTYACAGHMPPLLQVPGEAPRFLWDGRSAPLGSRAGRTARLEHRTVLPPGSRLLLYTDGLVERRDRSIDEGLRLLADELAERREAPLPGLSAALAGTLVGGDHPDDVCLICVALGAEDRLDRTIPADAVQIARLRQDLRGWLASHGLDEETRQAVLLACSEAVANAIEHGYSGDKSGVVVVAATMSSDAIEVQVSDQGSWRPASTDIARGRGLQLIRQVMDQVVISKDAGTTVTMRRRPGGTSR